MTKSSVKPPAASAAKVHTLAKLVTPPHWWELKSAFGYMRSDDSPTGQLVRLFDVLRWIEGPPSDLPRSVALEQLCERMPLDVMQWLYIVRPGAYAVRVPEVEAFGYITVQQMEAQRVKSRQSVYLFGRTSSGQRTAKIKRQSPIDLDDRDASEPGRPALLKALREYCLKVMQPATLGDVLDYRGNGESRLVCVAVPMHKAAEHWGYGRGDEEQAPLPPALEPVIEWTGEMLAKQQEVFKADTTRIDYTLRLSALTGIESREIRRRIRAYKTTKATAATPFSGLANRSSSTPTKTKGRS